MRGFLYGLAVGLAISSSIGIAYDPMLPTDPRGLDDYLLQKQYHENQQEIERIQRSYREQRRNPC